MTLVIATLSLLCGLIIGGYGAPALVGLKRGFLTLVDGSGGEQETLPGYYASQTACFRKLPAMTWDGLHLTGEAYLIWRDALPPILKT